MTHNPVSDLAPDGTPAAASGDGSGDGPGLIPPPSIRWGAAATASGAEGIAPRCNWSTWEADGRLPVSSVGSGFGLDFRSDLQLLADLGLSSLRLTLDWARLEPWSGRWDTVATDHFTEILEAARGVGIDVWATLIDGPLPGWFEEDERGFRDDVALRKTWPRHVDRIAETFGDLVAGWIPVLDPYTLAAEGFLVGTKPPAMTNPERFADVLLALHRASFEAWRLLESGEPLVACCIDTAPLFVGVQSREPDERVEAAKHVKRLDRIRFGSWMRALRDGVISIPGHAEIELDGLAGAYDVIGFTYRGAASVYADGTFGPYPTDAPIAPDGRSPWAEGLGLVARRLDEELPKRRFAVLGTGLTTPDDEWRTDLLGQTAIELTRAVNDGVDIGDVFWESVLDGWTPECGNAVPNGMIDPMRNERPSAELLRSITAKNGMLGS